MIKIRVEGMTCGHCEKTVREALASVPGVSEVVRVDRTANEAVVEGSVEVSALLDAVNDKGFEASIPPP